MSSARLLSFVLGNDSFDPTTPSPRSIVLATLCLNNPARIPVPPFRHQTMTHRQRDAELPASNC
jgi:hypothetical protein